MWNINFVTIAGLKEWRSKICIWNKKHTMSYKGYYPYITWLTSNMRKRLRFIKQSTKHWFTCLRKSMIFISWRLNLNNVTTMTIPQKFMSLHRSLGLESIYYWHRYIISSMIIQIRGPMPPATITIKKVMIMIEQLMVIILTSRAV